MFWFSEIQIRSAKDAIHFAQFGDPNIQVKNNEIVDSGNLKGDCICYNVYTGDCYIQVNFTVNIRHDFREVVRCP